MSDCIICPECEERSDDPVYCIEAEYLLCESCHECECEEA